MVGTPSHQETRRAVVSSVWFSESDELRSLKHHILNKSTRVAKRLKTGLANSSRTDDKMMLRGLSGGAAPFLCVLAALAVHGVECFSFQLRQQRAGALFACASGMRRSLLLTFLLLTQAILLGYAVVAGKGMPIVQTPGQSARCFFELVRLQTSTHFPLCARTESGQRSKHRISGLTRACFFGCDRMSIRFMLTLAIRCGAPGAGELLQGQPLLRRHYS
eukprot:1571643-Rhodomonas_salina.1